MRVSHTPQLVDLDWSVFIVSLAELTSSSRHTLVRAFAERFSWATPASIAFLFLTLNTMWPATSHSCCHPKTTYHHAFPTVIVCTLKLKSKAAESDDYELKSESIALGTFSLLPPTWYFDERCRKEVYWFEGIVPHHVHSTSGCDRVVVEVCSASCIQEAKRRMQDLISVFTPRALSQWPNSLLLGTICKGSVPHPNIAKSSTHRSLGE